MMTSRPAVAKDDQSGLLLDKIRLTVLDFSKRLGITQPVVVAIVPENPRLSSVQYDEEVSDAFYMSFAAEFVSTLDDEELGAAVAHEMGHIWIYTHFPYLQTEALANHQALKLVPIDSLVKVYRKVWRWKGEEGDLERVLGTAAFRIVSSSAGTPVSPHN